MFNHEIMTAPRERKVGWQSVEDAAYLVVLQVELARWWGNMAPIGSVLPLTLSLSFFMPMPERFSDLEELEAEGYQQGEKPDAIALAMPVIAAGAGVVWQSASCISDLRCAKFLSTQPRLLIELSEDIILWS